MSESLRILITGSNSGFGRLTAEALAGRGHHVWAAMREVGGRNAQAAAALRGWATERGVLLDVVEMDVTDDASVDAAVTQVLRDAGHLDVVVNNAGVFSAGHEEAFTPDEVSRVFDVNVLGPHRVNRAVLPSMRARGNGLLLQVSSGLARFILPCVGVYSASKAALEALTESWRYALAPLGIDAVIVEPGAFPTGISQKTLMGSDADRLATYGAAAALPEQMFAGFEEMLSGPDAPDPQLVADAIVALIEMPTEDRPLRTVVDPITGKAVEAINEATKPIQLEVLRSMELDGLASGTHRTA